MNILRFFRHLFFGRWIIPQFFSKSDLKTISEKIESMEKNHDAEIVFALEPSIRPDLALRGFSGRERAIDVFSELRVWDTELNNGILIYLLLADHDIEIIADRGAHRKIGQEFWDEVCREMEDHFRRKEMLKGVIHGIEKISEKIQNIYPKSKNNPNELENHPRIL